MKQTVMAPVWRAEECYHAFLGKFHLIESVSTVYIPHFGLFWRLLAPFRGRFRRLGRGFGHFELLLTAF